MKDKDCKGYLTDLWARVKNRLSWSPRLELPAWRWAKNFEWISRTHFEGRAIVLRNRNKRKLHTHLGIDTERNQTVFQPNKFQSAKYTPLSFLPLNIIEQFRRGANFYFLIVMILTWLIDAPISPESWLLSLLFVMVISMMKQGYEDYLRHKEDNRTNSQEVTIVKGDTTGLNISQNIKVGDIIYLREDQEVPCDCIVLSTSHKHGQCYVMTANLDGETSLKTRMSASLTKQAVTVQQVALLSGCLECENPNPKLDSFLGRLTLWSGREEDDVDVSPLSNDNLLLAGTVLKNTREVYACCVYAGTQTKISLNSKITKNKFSTIEKSLNKYLILFIVILLIEMAVSTVFSFTLDLEYLKGPDLYLFSLQKTLHFFGADKQSIMNVTNLKRADHRDNIQSLLGYQPSTDYPHAPYRQNTKAWYLDQLEEITFIRVLEMLLLWMVLYNYIIPLSMYVCLEMQKFLASQQFQWDRCLYDSERNQPAQCHTSDINEELGLVTHLFSDKTGTLTRNEMVLKMWVKDGVAYFVEELEGDEREVLEWDTFTMVLCLCHSVQVCDGEFVASSPDEKAILEFCRDRGILYQGEDSDKMVTISAKGCLHEFERIAELPFDSFRKCMTVILKDSDGTLHVVSKGAETTMFGACTLGDITRTDDHISQFAKLGLRTLVLGHKVITQEQLDAFTLALNVSQQSIVNRAKLEREVYQSLEQGLTLVGATGIEDRLQEEVVETVRDLKMAGIKVWMLTGDKKETAINLGYSAGLLNQSAPLLDLCDNSDPRDVNTLIGEAVEGFSQPMSGISPGLVIDGKSVSSLFKQDESKKQLATLASRCQTVIACRLSPIQKSQLVRLIKNADPNHLTAAIGDGGNDVSMLQEAHVGLGIIGVEGTAAAQASDFAFTKFQFLRRAFFVHGHWYYVRVSFLIQFSLYKNIACFTGQVFYMFYSNYSAQTLFESTFLFLYNTLYTAVPVMVYSILEQPIPAEKLLGDPKLYKKNHGNSLMSWLCLLKWLILGLWHSFCSFFMWIWLYQPQSPVDANTDIFCIQTAVAQIVVFIVNCKVLISSKYWTLPLLLTILGSSLSYSLITFLLHCFSETNFLVNSQYYNVYSSLVSDINMWLCTAFTVIVALIPDILLQVWTDSQSLLKPKINKTVPYVDPVL